MARTTARIVRKGPTGLGETHYLDVEREMTIDAEDIRLMEVYSGGSHVRYYCDDAFGYIQICIPGTVMSSISVSIPVSIEAALDDDGITRVSFKHDDHMDGVKFTATEDLEGAKEESE